MNDRDAELRARKLTDQDWSNLTAIISLPSEARYRIDRAIFLYRLMSEVKSTEPRQSELRANLLKVAAAATVYADLVQDLGFDELWLLKNCNYQSESRQPPSIAKVAELTTDARYLAKWLSFAATKVEERKPTSMVDWLKGTVSFLDQILREYTGAGVKRSNRPQQFVHAVFHLADPTIGPGSIESALKKVIRERGKNAS